MDSITLGQALGWLLAAATAFVTLYKVIDIIATHLKPQKDLREHMAEIDRKLFRDKINHELSGNGNDILRKSRDEIQEYLTNR